MSFLTPPKPVESQLTHLGKQSPIQNDPDKAVLDKIPNPHPTLYYSARFTIPEFTSKCPATGQPDFATLIIDYVPKKYLVESKSLKLWMFAFRDHGAFHEDVTVGIGKRLYDELDPYWIRIAGFWNGRGGISIDVVWEKGALPNANPLSLDNVKLYNNGHS
jgi:7-cyano-7-deazaguanine reductase